MAIRPAGVIRLRSTAYLNANAAPRKIAKIPMRANQLPRRLASSSPLRRVF